MQMQASETIYSTSMQYISENLQFSIMKNSIFPQSPSSQLYGFGFSDQAVSDAPLIDTRLNAYAYDDSFYMDTKPQIQNGFNSGLYSQQSPFVNYHSGPSSAVTIKRLDCPPFVASNHFHNKDMTHNSYDSKQQQQLQRFHVETVSSQPNQLGRSTSNHGTRKRPIENVDAPTKTSHELVTGNRKSSQTEQWTTATKKIAVPVQEKTQTLDHHVQKDSNKDVQRDRVPPRRSQKLADKITALQKLVSPYGKTDTASVLHEASIFIKVLQDEIKNSVHAITSTSVEEEEYPDPKIMGDIGFDLRGKGLCLVPVSLTKNLIKEDSFSHFSITNILQLHHNKPTQFN